ncbi:MAG: hypothetical protein JSR82_11985 [Verrucomicrobia bacterium]|nr:hypothetical protein [Verrucomicrobiota bacterium]
MARAPSPLDVVEAAYQAAASDDDWTLGLLTATRGLFERRSLGRAVFVVDARVTPPDLYSSIERFRGLSKEGAVPIASASDALDIYRALPAQVQDRIFFSTNVAAHASDELVATGRLGVVRLEDNPVWRASWPATVRDAFGLFAHGGTRSTCVLSVGLPEGVRVPPQELRVWGRVAAHLAAGLRLRSDAPHPDRAAAVLDREGRLVELREPHARARVTEAVARRRHARKRSVRPDEALDVWQGLHDGRWSVVDHIDTDGKAFVLAVRNTPGRDVPIAMTDRQRAAVSLASLGYSDKQIAYALGLSAGGVAMLLHRARLALGATTRAELIRRFKRALLRGG